MGGKESLLSLPLSLPFSLRRDQRSCSCGTVHPLRENERRGEALCHMNTLRKSTEGYKWIEGCWFRSREFPPLPPPLFFTQGL